VKLGARCNLQLPQILKNLSTYILHFLLGIEIGYTHWIDMQLLVVAIPFIVYIRAWYRFL
jgi:hypothetical protein